MALWLAKSVQRDSLPEWPCLGRLTRALRLLWVSLTVVAEGLGSQEAWDHYDRIISYFGTSGITRALESFPVGPVFQ